MRDQWRALVRDRRAVAGLAIVGAFAALAIVGPTLVGDPAAIVDVPRRAPSAAHWLGTNGRGQDVLAQVVAGARTTLAVAFSVGLLVTLIGAAVGVAAAYFGRHTDTALSLVTNVSLVIPGLPLAVVLAAYLPPGPVSLAAVLVLSGWAWNARVFRAQALTLRRRDYVSAAIVAGESPMAVIAREIAPNMLSLMASAFIGATIYAIAAQVGLEFLGLGDMSAVTWGSNLYWAANDAALITGTWWEFLPTGLCIALVGFGLSLVNFGIDGVANPRLRPVKHRAEREPGHGPARAADEPEALALELRELRVAYPGADSAAVEGVSLTVAPGEIVGLAGESGSGKTTLGYAIMRLLPGGTEISGDVRVAGRDPARAPRWRDASMVFQSALNALNPVLTVREQLCDVLRAHLPLDRRTATARAAELLALVELSAADLDAYPHQLSGGMRQRVVIAMALALRPRLVIMDEPTTALDVVVQKQILERVVALQEELDFGVLFISHDLGLLLSVCDRVGVMQGGRLVELAAAATLREDARDPYTRRLIASSRPPTHPPVAPAENAAPALTVRHLRKRYARKEVLADIGFEVRRGEVLALVGRSGSGKSTIARLIARLEPSDGGSIQIGGDEAAALPQRAYRRRVQKVFQDPFGSLNPFYRVGYAVERPLRRLGNSTHPHADSIALLEAVGLQPAAELARRYPHELSGGQLQRVAVARALAADPEVIVADEPTSMVDASIRADLLRLLRDLARDRELAIVLITHDLASAAGWADRVVVLDGGRIVEAGTAERVFAEPEHPTTALLVEAARCHGGIES